MKSFFFCIKIKPTKINKSNNFKIKGKIFDFGVGTTKDKSISFYPNIGLTFFANPYYDATQQIDKCPTLAIILYETKQKKNR